MKNLVFLLLFVGGAIFADPYVIKIDLPKTRTDGKALTLSEITEVYIHCDGDIGVRKTAILKGPFTTRMLEWQRDFANGEHVCMARVATGSLISPRSNMHEFVIPKPVILQPASAAQVTGYYP